MANNNVLVRKMTDYDRDVGYEVANVFVDGYYKDLSFFSKDREKLRNAFKGTFCPDVFYLAEMDGKIAGMLACSNNRQRAMHIDKTMMKRHLGFVMGNLAYYLLKKEFNTPLTYPDNTGYIECVATSEAARGKGVCTALFQHVMQELPYREFILDVADTNQNAYRLYKKLGFSEFMRKQEKHPKLKGFNERVYMKWTK
ncbi:GNAT family N-acetyltransferase [Pseudoclostridium thermosuccinogenes]|jgi:ribosomal protein S18 acetylase RimI-like enzyme|uniref:GNAT family N-acetyltransferase n=1 Tax=Clostridium thermosuccinogenes TaxID=84032 RepID=UPI002FDA1FA2